MGLISIIIAQSIIIAIGKIHIGLKVAFRFRHATPSHYQHQSNLDELVGEYSIESVSNGKNLYYVYVKQVTIFNARWH